MLLVLLACATPEDPAALSEAELARALAATPRAAPAPDPTNAVADDPAAAALGQFLFFDARLSADGAVSCATCHDPALGFGDGELLSEGQGSTARHAPTVWNTANNRWFFWDGRADSHWAQALGPLEAPNEHGSSRLAIAHLLAADPDLSLAYTRVFGALPELADGARFPPEGRPVPDDPEHPHALAWASMAPEDQDAVTRVFVNVGKAIAAYERLLVSGESPFDRYMSELIADGQSEALSEEARLGLKRFMGEARCHLCHSGPDFTDHEFHNLGLSARSWLDPLDTGRYDGVSRLLDDPFNAAGPWSDAPEGDAARVLARLVVGAEEDLARFKTPGLRDVALSPPYMHGGHFLNLEEVVHHYNLLQEAPTLGHREDLLLPLELDIDEVMALVAFMEALTGEPLDEALLTPPASPFID